MSLSGFQLRRRVLAKQAKLKEVEKEGVKDDNNTRKSKKRPADKRDK